MRRAASWECEGVAQLPLEDRAFEAIVMLDRALTPPDPRRVELSSNRALSQ